MGACRGFLRMAGFGRRFERCVSATASHMTIAHDPIELAYFGAVASCAVVLALRYSIAWIQRNRHRHDHDREPRCATCGYIVARCESAICPECGRDVCENGLITSRVRSRVGIVPLYVLAVLIACPVAVRVGKFLAHQQPLFGWQYTYEQMVSLSNDRGRLLGPRYAVQSGGTGRFFGKHPSYLWVYCNTDGDGQPMLVVDVHTGQFAVVDSTGQRSGARLIDDAVICEFLRLRSPNGPDVQLRNASERIVSSIRAQMAGKIGEEQMLTDVFNGSWLSYSLSGSVITAMIVLCMAFMSVVLVAMISAWRRRSVAKQRQLWRTEFRRLGLGRQTA